MLDIRLEQPGDYRAVEQLTRDAFWNLHHPGCDEHYLAHILRDSPDFLPALDFVALDEGQIVGNIMYSRAKVVREDGSECPTILFGPLSVAPGRQRMGVGSALVRHSLRAARAQGFASVFIYGDPAYYQRFGFVSMRDLGVTEADGVPNAALQALALVPGAIDGLRGRLHEAPVFSALDAQKTDAFDATFPPLPKIKDTQSQLDFAALLAQMRG